MFGFKKKRKLSLEEKLQSLEEVGVALEPDRSIDELLESFGREEYEGDSYDDLLFALSNEVETGLNAGASYTKQLFHSILSVLKITVITQDLRLDLQRCFRMSLRSVQLRTR